MRLRRAPHRAARGAGLALETKGSVPTASSRVTFAAEADQAVNAPGNSGPTRHRQADTFTTQTAIDRGEDSYYFARQLGEPRQGAERPSSANVRHGDPPNLIQFILA